MDSKDQWNRPQIRIGLLDLGVDPEGRTRRPKYPKGTSMSYTFFGTVTGRGSESEEYTDHLGPEDRVSGTPTGSPSLFDFTRYVYGV